MIQITLIRLEGYGPWTTTLGDDREHRYRYSKQGFTVICRSSSQRGMD